jgi:hypothetical protein
MKVLDRDLVSGENKFKKQNLSKAQSKKIRSKTHKKLFFIIHFRQKINLVLRALTQFCRQ